MHVQQDFTMQKRFFWLFTFTTSRSHSCQITLSQTSATALYGSEFGLALVQLTPFELGIDFFVSSNRQSLLTCGSQWILGMKVLITFSKFDASLTCYFGLTTIFIHLATSWSFAPPGYLCYLNCEKFYGVLYSLFEFTEAP